ncbi:MAG: 2-oxo acid dehydrogenase subunit E2 [Ferruginibacter sp.]
MAVLQEIKVPLLSVNDTSLTVVDTVFAQGALVKTGDIVLVLETSKTTYDIPAENDGFINYLCGRGQDYEVNDIIATIVSEANEVIKPVNGKIYRTERREVLTGPAVQWEGESLFSDAAIKLIAAAGIEKSAFADLDFVSREDVEAILGIEKKVPSSKTKAASATVLLPVDDKKVTVEKLSSNKRREIEYLSAVQSAGLTSTIHTFVETAGIFVHINQSLKFLKNSLLPVIIYETARLLEKYTSLNAYFTGDATAIYRQVDIGFAVDIDKGLKVLKIPQTASKSIIDIEAEILTLSNKYIDDKLEINDLAGISFTITDLSAEGIAFFKPLVNSMNSAILGIAAVDEKLDRCTLSVTFDHRVTEGKLVAGFLKELKGRLESYQSKFQPHPYRDISCFKCFKTLKDDLSDAGFSKCITPQGREAYICQSCFKGF